MTETQTKRSNGATLQVHYNFSAIRDHLQALNSKLIDLLGDDYAINLYKPNDFTVGNETFIRFETRCIYFTHNKDHYDYNPSGWIGVSPKGTLISGCWVCGRKQFVFKNDDKEYQPATTLLTLSRNDKRLLTTLLVVGCKELPTVKDKENPPEVAFPVVYGDGTTGFHYRRFLTGKNKWRHMQNGRASEAVFGLHIPIIKQFIQAGRFVIVTESPLDATTLFAAGYPAIAVLGEGNADALACDYHKETLLSLIGDDGEIFVWQEPDAAGFAQQVANALQRPVKVISPPVTEEEDQKALKDAYRLWLACGKDWDRFKAEIDRLIANATEIAPQPEPEVVKHETITKVKVTIPESAFKRLGEIVMQEVDWLVNDYIPIGAVTLLAGEGGHGKSTLLCDLAASILKGDKWLNRFEVAQGGVILIVTEGITEIRSRLDGYGITSNDPLIIVDLTAWDDYTPLKAAQALPEILRLAKERLGDIPIRLVGLDCLRGFGFDEKQASRQKGDRLPTVREIYNPLTDFAQQEGAAVVVTHHFRKLQPDERRRLFPKRKKGKEVAPDIDINLLRNLIAGTADIVNAARQALVVVSDLEAGVGIIVPVKSNRSQVLGVPIRYDWQTDAPTFLNFMDEDETAIEKATAFLRRVLANGALASEEVKAQAEKEGISRRTLWRAKSRLGVKSAKQVNGDEVVWIWFLPDRPDPHGSPTNPQETPPDRPDQHGSPNGDGSAPNSEDNPKLGTLGTVAPKPKQNLAFSSVPNEEGFGTVGTVGTDPADNEVCQVCQTQNPLAQTLAHLKSPINKGISEQVCQVCQTSDNLETRAKEAPQAARPEPDPLPTAGSPTELFVEFFDAGLLPDLIVEGSPPANEREIEFIRINSISQPEPEDNPPVNEPVTEGSPQGCPEGDLQDEPDGGDGNPPNPQNNGSQTGFAPPVAPAIPTVTPSIRMTVRLPDGSVKLAWQDKTETVAPYELDCWQPIETIPEISLPSIESVEIPPTVVIDIETTDKNPQRGRILAAGLALYVEGKEVETQIFYNEGDEAALLAQTFDWLRETCNDLGEIILTGYNIFDFDLTFLIERARKLKVACPFRFIRDENGKIKRWRVAATEGTLKSDPLDFNAIIVDRNLPIRIVDTLHLVCRWDYTAKQLIHYDLKSVAEHFTVNIPNRPVLTHKQIVHAYYHDRPRFNAYLLADLRETYALFAKLFPPYAGVAALTRLPLEKVAVKSTAWVWQQILKRYYNETPQPDEKRDYEGGLVVSRKGLWSPCLKIDIASLYPTIMLAYRIHSRKDPDEIALRWLKTLTLQRLALKAKAKAGDANAQIKQEAMKILLNSLYGFYGTPKYPFNDMNAAEKVTAIGRKVLTCMIAAIEDKGGIIVEADTDGLIVCYRNADPQEILKAVSEAIPEVFKVETEWQEATVFVSDDKNYVVLHKEGKPTVKGSKWRGRDKPAYAKKVIPDFLQKWATEGVEAALNFAKQVWSKIRSGNGWDYVVQTHRVGEDDENFIRAGFEVGERAVFAYKVRAKKAKDSEIAKSPEEGYDCKYYAAKFSETVKEVIEVIDPAQIAAWERMVK